MDSILSDRLLALVRPGNDLVLRRIRNLKRCVQTCGCNITTPRYAPQFGSRLHFKRGQALPKETPFPFFSGALFLGPLVFIFCFFLALQRLARLKCNLEPNCGAHLGVVILQPHACAQRFRFRILRRTRSFPGRTSARSLSDRIESIWETPSKERVSLHWCAPPSRSRKTRALWLPSSRSSGPLSEAALLLEICSLLQPAQFFVRKRSPEKSEVLVTVSVLCGREELRGGAETVSELVTSPTTRS